MMSNITFEPDFKFYRPFKNRHEFMAISSGNYDIKFGDIKLSLYLEKNSIVIFNKSKKTVEIKAPDDGKGSK